MVYNYTDGPLIATLDLEEGISISQCLEPQPVSEAGYLLKAAELRGLHGDEKHRARMLASLQDPTFWDLY